MDATMSPATGKSNRPKVGKLLVDEKVITLEQLEKALAEQQDRAMRLGQMVVDLGYAQEGEGDAAPLESRQHEYRERHQQRQPTDDEQSHQSVNSLSRVESSESNSRLMWNTTMPMTNTPTKTSSSTPSSSRNGTLSVCVRPKR